MALGVVRVINLGRFPYLPTFHLQKWFEQRSLNDEKSEPVLILVEHNPVYTAGFREKIDEEVKTKLMTSGAEFIQSNRGGLMTFHGPGQLVAYPIFHLQRLRPRLTLRRYVSLLEETAIHTCRMLGIPARLSDVSVSHTGAWVNDKKICAIGVHCRRYVTTHGLALNNTVDLGWYANIVPCGIPDKGVTSIQSELDEVIPMETVTSQFLQSFQSIFKCQLGAFDETILKNVFQSLNSETQECIK